MLTFTTNVLFHTTLYIDEEFSILPIKQWQSKGTKAGDISCSTILQHYEGKDIEVSILNLSCHNQHFATIQNFVLNFHVACLFLKSRSLGKLKFQSRVVKLDLACQNIAKKEKKKKFLSMFDSFFRANFIRANFYLTT